MLYFAIIIFVLLGYSLYIYNRFVTLNTRVHEAWSDIDVQLKLRHDLIPNVVETVKSYGEYEQETLEEITTLRTQSQQVSRPSEKQGIEGGISQDLKKIIALAEAYPDLKADKNFRHLQQTLTEVEDKLQYARRYYNGTVRDFNILVQSAPSNLIANMFGYESKEFFEIEYATERANPEIDLS